MLKKICLVFFAATITSCSLFSPKPPTEGFRLISKNFEHGQEIPDKFTCDGVNVSPHLRWTDAPEDAQSFALSMIDPDAPGGDFVHWMVYNIPGDMIAFSEAKVLNKVADEAISDFQQTNYRGPCPPSGKHRYFFTIYALDIDRADVKTKEGFKELVEQHTIEKAELMGTYRR